MRTDRSEVAAIGEQPQVAGFALAGARVYVAESSAQVLATWDALPSSVAVVILTPAAAAALDDKRFAASGWLTVVMPP